MVKILIFLMLFCNFSLFFLAYTNEILSTEQSSNINNKKKEIPPNSFSQKVNDLNYSDPKTSATLTPKNAYAIIVGISDYPGSNSDLSYCDDDAIGVYNLLIDDYNFKRQNVIYLQDSRATQHDINNAFNRITSKITENDIFFFYYSGHGGFGTEVGPFSHTIETPHPYPTNYDQTWNIYHPGAEYMRVHFYRFQSETNFDFALCGDSSVTSGWYYELYTGDLGYDIWSSYIPVNNRYYIRFISDWAPSWAMYGFRIDRYEAIVDDGTHFLCSYDSIPNDPNKYYLDSLLDSKLDNVDCAEKYVVLDSCNSGGMIPEVQEIGRYIMTACEDDELSFEDSSLGHGVFTNFFLDSLDYATDSNGDGVKSMGEFFSYTYDETVAYSSSFGHTYHPQEYNGISGESVLYPSLGNVSITTSATELTYSFTTFGNGLIEKLFVGVCSTSAIFCYNIDDLTVNPASVTGFGSYSGTLQLVGAFDITGYGIYAEIEGNKLIRLNNTNSLDFDKDLLDDILEIMSGLNSALNDTDSDGLGDAMEFYGNSDPLLPDTDGDRLMDGEEVLIYSTNPSSRDSDNDRMDDFFEVYYGLNPLVDDADSDKDDDGLDNIEEYEIGSDPNDDDTDNDEMPDGWEYENDLDLFKDDAGSDPDKDSLVNLREYEYETDPKNYDTDNDGYSDGVEVSWGTDPLNPYYSLNSIFLNMAGIALLCIVGYYLLRTSIVKINNKEEKKLPFKLKENLNNYNSLKIDVITKPRILKPSYTPYSPYKTATSYRSPINQTLPLDLSFHELKNILLNKMPPPKSQFTPEGKRAMSIAVNAFKYLSEGRLKEAIESMVLALTLGVPEPINGQIKAVLIDLIEKGGDISNLGIKSPPLGDITEHSHNRCNSCGTLNSTNDKFCGNCGLKLEQEMKFSPQTHIICKSCGKSNSLTNKFCIKCGVKIVAEKRSPILKMEKVPIGYKKCNQCGYLNESLNKFCIKCGRAL